MNSDNFDFDLDLLDSSCQVPALELPLPVFDQQQQQQQKNHFSSAASSTGRPASLQGMPAASISLPEVQPGW